MPSNIQQVNKSSVSVQKFHQKKFKIYDDFFKVNNH